MSTKVDRQELFPKIERLCQHLLGDRLTARQTAEDIWTDFVLVHASKVQTAAASEAYLRVLTVRRCQRLNLIQQRHVALEPAVPEPVCELPTPEDALIAATEEQRRRALLERCMQKLDRRARALLELRYHQGLTQESIGERLGVSKQYAGRILARTVDALRGCVGAAA